MRIVRVEYKALDAHIFTAQRAAVFQHARGSAIPWVTSLLDVEELIFNCKVDRLLGAIAMGRLCMWLLQSECVSSTQ